MRKKPTLNRYKFPGINTVRKRLADGTVKVMRYHRASRKRIYSEPGSPAFDLEYRRIVEGCGPAPQASHRPMFVYFVRGETVGLVKIGQTRRIAQRLDALQTASPDRLVLLGTMIDPSNGALEAALHQQFSAHRAHGEWFHPSPELLEFISAKVAGSLHPV